MAYHIGGELVRGDDKVIGTALGQASLNGMGGYRGSQPVQRVHVKGLFQDRLHCFGGRHVRWSIRPAAS
jgi:hypothetical protein